MERYQDCPLVLREFLSYHETIKGQSPKTISEYYLDLRMFLRFMKLIKQEMPYRTDLETIPIRDIDMRSFALSILRTSLIFSPILQTIESFMKIPFLRPAGSLLPAAPESSQLSNPFTNTLPSTPSSFPKIPCRIWNIRSFGNPFRDI